MFTARYVLIPYIQQIWFVFKGLFVQTFSANIIAITGENYGRTVYGEQNVCSPSVLTYVAVMLCSRNGDCSRWQYVGNTVNITYLCKSDSMRRYTCKANVLKD